MSSKKKEKKERKIMKASADVVKLESKHQDLENRVNKIYGNVLSNSKGLAALNARPMTKEGIVAGTERDQMDHNANAFVASVLDPFKYTGVRKPDLTMAPTSVYCDNYKVSIPLHTMVDSTQLGGITIVATPTDQYTYVNGGATYTTPAWIAKIDSPNAAYMVSNFSAIRCVSMGIRVINYGILQSRGCIGAAGLVNTENAMTNLTDFLNSPTTRLLDVNDETHQINWLPINTVFHDGTQNEILCSEWHEPGAAFNEIASVDQMIALLFWQGDATVSASDALEVEITVNYEAIPLQSVRRNHDMQSAVGGGESVANAWNKAVDKSSGGIVEAVVNGAKNAGAKLAKAVVNDPEGALKFGKSAWKFMSRAGKQFLKEGLPMLGESLLFADKHYQTYLLCIQSGLKVSPQDPILARLDKLSLTDRASKIEDLLAEKYRSLMINKRLLIEERGEKRYYDPNGKNFMLV